MTFLVSFGERNRRVSLLFMTISTLLHLLLICESYEPHRTLLLRKGKRFHTRSRRSLSYSVKADDLELHALAGIEIRPSPGKGMGAFAVEQIAQNDVVGDYEGEILTAMQIANRYGGGAGDQSEVSRSKTPEDKAWEASRRERGVGLSGNYVVQVATDVFVDAEDPEKSSWCRYLNHESTGNGGANVALKCLEHGMGGKPRVWFVALRDITPGEEICFDYDGSEGTYWKDEDSVVAT